jgi:hypothetical protein
MNPGPFTISPPATWRIIKILRQKIAITSAYSALKGAKRDTNSSRLLWGRFLSAAPMKSLFADTEFLDDLTVSIQIFPFQVVQQPSSLTDKLQQTTA